MRPSTRNRRSRLLQFVVALSLSVLSSCAFQPQWPPITRQSTMQHTPGLWVWAELFTADVAAAKTFYGGVFGWEFRTLGSGPDAYTLVTNQDTPIAGILHRKGSSNAPHLARWVGFASVADVDRAAEYAAFSGGEVLVEPRELPGRGKVALIADPEGGRFGVLRSNTGDPPDSLPPQGALLWRELWARDGAAMAEFYAPLGGYQIQLLDEDRGTVERRLLSGGHPRAGIIEHDLDDLPSAWLHYVRVADLAEALDRVREGGGAILIAPTPNIRQGRVALVADPLGGAIGIAEWPESQR
jgi:predicted enzyme related to lactoylglutathione lyase